ncbi:unnamed protein product [Chrysoparadoxa australica]
MLVVEGTWKAKDHPEGFELLLQHRLGLAEAASAAGQHSIAQGVLSRADLQCKELLRTGSSALAGLQCQLAEAHVYWHKGEAGAAIGLAKQVTVEVQRLLEEGALGSDYATAQELQAKALSVAGSWMASSRSESSAVILDGFLRSAAGLAVGDNSQRASTHLTLADYVASVYAKMKARQDSTEWAAACKVAESRQEELNACLAKEAALRAQGKKAKDELHNVLRHVNTLKREVAIDKNQHKTLEDSIKRYLVEALGNYEKVLQLSTEANTRAVFKIISLWFDNVENEEVTRKMSDIVESAPSYKFIPLSYQISSRIASGSKAFSELLDRLVRKLCKEHPHHVLPKLFALANGDKVSGKGAAQFKANVSTEKIDAARAILRSLEAGGGELQELIGSMRLLLHAYIKFAMADTTSLENAKKWITFKDIKLSGLHSLENCLWPTRGVGSRFAAMPAVLTKPPAVQPSGQYKDVLKVKGFDSGFTVTAAGIHRPKIILCQGTDGNNYKQLVKGEDDIRQDGVMQQVFDTVNIFLQENPAARSRQLHVSTYTIVPVSPDSGVLEWVENTLPFGAFLTDSKTGAHRRYYPNDYTHTKCRAVLKSATTPAEKRAKFADIERNFHPAFRFFFLENFLEPFQWYRSRLNYVHSVAVSSIVGYVLGIGDRHAQNILVHQKTAEVVHIDFGVTFEQGKVLLTPETVPFRLTRDIIDGMGVTGTEGVFKRSCEAVMHVLKDNASSLLTILQVFIHDPLYRWMLSPFDARQRQVEDENGLSDADPTMKGPEGGGAPADAAARALLRIRQKLQGYEDPNGDSMSVEGQVMLLLNQAKDPDNLSQLFPGWAPWL